MLVTKGFLLRDSPKGFRSGDNYGFHPFQRASLPYSLPPGHVLATRMAQRPAPIYTPVYIIIIILDLSVRAYVRPV